MSPMFSVCMSVYHGDNATFFSESLNSVFNQTLPPDELILVVDGPVGDDINNVIKEFEYSKDSVKVIRLEKNSGHAIARQTGLEAAKNNLCAVMDSDDIAVSNRFEKQINAFELHPDVSVVGSVIKEFIGTPENVVGTRMVPENDKEVKEYLKSRCPMNLMTVMLKKDDVMKVGGFLDWYCEEDYYLWIRLAMEGYKFYNIQEDLVKARVGKEMYQRRGGMKYFKSEARLQKYMFDHNIIGFPKLFYNIFVRFIVQVLLPNKLRGWVFQTFARN